MGDPMTNQPFTHGQLANLRRGRVSEDFACYSITKTVEWRRPVIAADRTAQVLIGSWAYLRSSDRIKVFAFCIMPDHYHLMLCLMPGQNLSKVMEDSGKFTAREINNLIGGQGQFWQNGFHDHCCRDTDDLHELCLYIEHNPVRKQLVEAPELWPYSSAVPGNKYLLDREWWP
jgi:putative transposase